MAPFVSDPSATSPFSTQWQWCEFSKAGITPTFVNRQYYAGGFDGPDVASLMASDLQPFTCGVVSDMAVPPANMSPDISIDDVCSFSSSAPHFATCAQAIAGVVAAYPDVAGATLWNYDEVSATGQPAAYACEVGNVLNGSSNACD
jgi:hypothetical protein